jgi:hypothetical protein
MTGANRHEPKNIAQVQKEKQDIKTNKNMINLNQNLHKDTTRNQTNTADLWILNKTEADLTQEKINNPTGHILQKDHLTQIEPLQQKIANMKKSDVNEMNSDAAKKNSSATNATKKKDADKQTVKKGRGL